MIVIVVALFIIAAICGFFAFCFYCAIDENKSKAELARIKLYRNLFIATTIFVLIGAIITLVINANTTYEPSNHNINGSAREKCSWCGKMVDADDMKGNWCKDCQNDAFGKDGWYN